MAVDSKRPFSYSVREAIWSIISVIEIIILFICISIVGIIFAVGFFFRVNRLIVFDLLLYLVLFCK